MELNSTHLRIRWARQHHGKFSTPTEAARAFGWPVSTYLGHENGDRQPSRDTARRYAKAYGVRWEWLLEGEGSPTIRLPQVKIIGFVTVGGKVIFYQTEKVRACLYVPPHAGVATVALEAGASMRGVADSGWLYFYEDEKRPPTKDLLGKLCIVALNDGQVLIRTLQPGRRRNHYDLESTTEATLRDQEIDWAALITWIKPR